MGNRTVRRAISLCLGYSLVTPFAGGQPAVSAANPRLLVQTWFGQINSFSFAPRGDLVAIGSEAEVLILVDLAQQKELRRFRHPGSVGPVAWTPDGAAILTGCGDGIARLWDIRTGRELQRFTGHTESVDGVAVSRDGRSAFTASEDKTVRMWDIASGRQLQQLEYVERLSAVAVSPDGKWLAVGINNYFSFTALSALAAADNRKLGPRANVALIDVAAWKEVRKLSSEFAEARAVAFSPNGALIAAATSSGLQVWSFQTGKALADAGHKDANSVSFSPDQKFVLTGGGDGVAALWDLLGGGVRRFGKPETTRKLAQLSANGDSVITGGFDGILHIWDVATGTQTGELKGPVHVAGVEFSRNMRFLRASYEGWAETDRWETTWNLATGSAVIRSTSSSAKTLPAADTASEFPRDGPRISPDGSLIAEPEEEGVVLREAKSGRPLFHLKAPNFAGFDFGPGLAALAFVDGGRKLLTLDMPNGVYFRVWDVKNGLPVREFGPKYYWFRGSALSPDGKFILVATNNYTPDGGKGQPDDRTASIWNIETGEETLQLARRGEDVTAVAYSKDGSEILLGKQDGSIDVRDSRTGERKRTLTGHAGSVVDIALSSDGSIVATGGADSTVRFFDLAAGQELASTISTGQGGWFVTEPGGRFDTNDLDHMPNLSWIAGDDPLRALAPEIFMRQYYTPRLLARILAGEKFPPLPSVGSLNRAQPKVTIAGVLPGSAEATVDVDVEVTETSYLGRQSGAQDLRLFRDGRLVGYREGAIALDRNGRAKIRFQGIHRPRDGQSKLELSAYAFNRDRVKGTTAALAVELPALPRVKPRAYVVSIGVNEMPAVPELRLRFAANDATRIGGGMRKILEAGGRFAQVDVRQLESTSSKRGGATKAAIRSQFEALARVVGPEDFVLISFSGHGYADPSGTFHIFPSDILPGPSHLPRGTISTAELTEWLRPVDGRDMVLILDSCQSAASVEAGGFRPGPMGDPGLGQLAYDKRMRILAATQVADSAIESDRLRQGLLTYALTKEGLDDGKADWQPADGRIRLGEWLNFGVRRVPELYEDLKAGRLRGVIVPARSSEVQRPALYDFTRSTEDDLLLR